MREKNGESEMFFCCLHVYDKKGESEMFFCCLRMCEKRGESEDFKKIQYFVKPSKSII